jgi:hypothetical protein
MKLIKLVFCAAVFILWGFSVFAALDVQFVGSIKQSPDPAFGGIQITFTVNFKPVGGAVSNFKITGGVDGTKIFERKYASIGAGIQKTDSFKWIAVGGVHNVWFELDPDHTSGDSDYSNNKITKSVTVSSGSGIILNENTKPDQQHISKLGKILGDRMAGPTDLFTENLYVDSYMAGPVKAGVSTFVKCTWKRTGQKPKSAFRVHIYVGQDLVPDYNASSYGHPDEIDGMTYGIWKFPASGNYTLKCVLKWKDPNYTDTNPANNTMTKTVYIPQ